jgi:acetate kinase
MHVLTINAGSSSLKFELLEQRHDAWQSVATGQVDRIGRDSHLRLEAGGELRCSEPVEAPDVEAAAELALGRLGREVGLAGVDAVGHRVVHGGPAFNGPVRIDAAVIKTIEALSDLAPLHNLPSLAAIKVAQARLPSAPHVAAFDTTFYAGLPEHVALYAIPRELSEKHAIRRYGFHGLAHRYMVRRYLELHPAAGHPRLVTLQLGNGCSVTASAGGAPVETSMGFTPLEGLIMGTRSGDLDPSVPLYIAEKEGLKLDDVESLLNRRSGLLGLSGRSSDMRDLLQAADAGDAGARLAVNAFCHRVRRYLGAYLAVLHGADAILFGGGIGENAAPVRSQVCAGFDYAGLRLDERRNNASPVADARISANGSKMEAWVIAVREAVVIADDILAVVGA